jgi:hypothetical protein
MSTQYAATEVPIFAFIGWTDAGPVGEEVLIDSWLQYESVFGGVIQGRYLGHAVSQFFRNGRTRASVLRLAHASETTAAVSPIAGISLTANALDSGQNNIRRLTLFLASSLYHEIPWALDEQGAESLWDQARRAIGTFLHGMFLEGAFAGATPQQAYFVKCDADNNLSQSIPSGILNITVGFAPLYPAEFVIIQIQQMMSSGGTGSLPQRDC